MIFLEKITGYGKRGLNATATCQRATGYFFSDWAEGVQSFQSAQPLLVVSI